MSEFTGMGFSIQPVWGARAFNVDKLGRLTGITHPQVWTPGENVADCRKIEYDALRAAVDSLHFRLSTYSYGGYQPSPAAKNEVAKVTPETHSLKGCACGFYAYLDGSNDYGDKGRVNAVVEGWGEVILGTRGFRAQKARIVALHIRKSVDKPLANRLRHNYKGIPVYNSFDAMVEKHAVDSPSLPSPETDADFWTRSAS